MKGGNNSISGKTRFIRIGCVLLLLCLALSGCGQPTEEKAATPAENTAQQATAEPSPEPTPEPAPQPSAWDTAFETGNCFLEETYFIPDDLTGFTIGLVPGEESQFGITGEPVRTDENGLNHYALTGELAQGIIQLHPVPQSIGPDGTVLWFIDSRSGFRGIFIQRDHEFLSVHVNENRGVTDKNEIEFMQKMSSAYCDTFEWSPDGRYVFYNNWSRWRNYVYDRLMLPFLLDTRTGEVFLVYSLPGLNQIAPAAYINRNARDNQLAEKIAETALSCGTWDGHFSRDGRYLYLLMYGINLPGWESGKALMRYDLETGQTERCCWLSEDACSFREMEGGRLLVCCADSDWQAVTAGDSGFTVTALEGSAIPGTVYLRFYNGLNDSDAVLDCGHSALAVIRDRSESVDEWIVITDPDQGARKCSTQELSGIYNRYFYDVVIPVRNTPYVILRISGFRTVAESWTSIIENERRLMLLNTDTMALKPLNADYETLINTHNETTSGELLLGDTITYRLNPDKAVPVKEEEPEWTAYRLECWNTPVDQVRESTRIRDADYLYEYAGRKKTDPSALVFSNRSQSRMEGFQFDSDIQVLDGRCLLTVRLQLNLLKEKVPEYVIPPVLTEERYAEVIGKNGIDVTTEAYVETGELIKGKIPKKEKVTVSMYEKITPEDLPEREDAEKLTEKYPSVAEQPLYILSSLVNDDDKKALREKLEGIYTLDDYWQDFELTNGSRWTKVRTSPGYTIHSDNPDIRWTQGPALALCSLSDRLGSAVYYRYATADPKPESVESLGLDGRCEVIGIPWQVSLESVQEEGDELTVVFSVVPEGEYGMFPVGNETETKESEGGDPT